MKNNLSLEKYSYHLISIDWNGNVVYQSTGFFIEKQSRLFFVTTLHSLTGWNPIQLFQTPNYPDETNLILKPIKSSERFDVFGFKIIQQKKININNDLDIEILEFDPDLKKCYTINSIESFIKKDNIELKGNFHIYGYSNKHKPGTSLIDILLDKPKKGILEFVSEIKNSNLFEIRKISHEVSQGFSGAPVFSVNDNNIAFSGVCVAGDRPEIKMPKLLIVKSTVIIELIDKILESPFIYIQRKETKLNNWLKFNNE